MPRVLIVDDNPADVDLIREGFVDAAIAATVIVAENGSEALDLLALVARNEAPAPDAVLLDLNMPRINGRDVLAFIKGTPELAGIPTIILTSSSSPKDRSECLAAGADAFYTKPNTLDQLLVLVREIHGFIRDSAGDSGANPLHRSGFPIGSVRTLAGDLVASLSRAARACAERMVAVASAPPSPSAGRGDVVRSSPCLLGGA
jgi:CheY-like chemotaxis protein